MGTMEPFGSLGLKDPKELARCLPSSQGLVVGRLKRIGFRV